MSETIEEKERKIRQRLTTDNRRHLYAVASYLPGETAERVGLEIPCNVYAQDPLVASEDSAFEPEPIRLHWEPALAAGPTSARLAVVDYDADHDRLVPPVVWDQESFCFLRPDGEQIGGAAEATSPKNPWFRQVNAWATVQAVLEYFEEPQVLGRSIPWGFAGNRLMIVPHAGYQANAYYNRKSKALQLYYYGDPENPKYSSLNHDILAHETGHAILDGVRPLLLEHLSRDTAAFHEAIGDLTALLVSFRHNHGEAHPSEVETIDPARLAPWLKSIAEEFGRTTRNRPFLRSAENDLKVTDLKPSDKHHHASQVITGAMFDCLKRIAAGYLSPERQAKRTKKATVRNALWWAAQRMGRLVFQPLDLLPPADVGFTDYARAVLRNLEITDPSDENDYGELVRQVFHERGFCRRPYAECDRENCDLAPSRPPRPKIYHPVDRICRSRADAYRFLHDNRDDFEIPANRDFEIVDLYVADKYGAAAQRLRQQVVVEYVWREELALDGPDYGGLSGRKAALPCGGTVVLDEGGNLISWSHKPGRESEGGAERRSRFRGHLAALAASGQVAQLDHPAIAALGVRGAPVLAETVDGALRFHTAPHLCNRDSEEDEEQWTTSF